MTSMILPEKDYRESVVVSFDFSDEAASVTAPVVTCTVYFGATPDAAVGSMVSGAASINGTSPALVLQRIAGGKNPNDYALVCTATSNAGDTLVRAAVLPVRTLPD